MKPDLITRLFHVWFLMTRAMTLGVRGLAFDAQGRVLLVKHTYVSGWHLPGGGVEPGQTTVEALAMELREEANSEFGDPPRLRSVHFSNRITRRDHVVVYLCENIRQLAPKTADREILAAEFFALDELPEGITESSTARIREFTEGVTADPYW